MVLIAYDLCSNYNFVGYADYIVGSLFIKLFGGDLQSVNI